MNVLKEIAIALLTSSVVVSVLVWFLKQYIKKRLSYEFQRRESLFEKRLEHADLVESRLIDTRMGIYPELMELIYRLSVIIRDGFSQPSAAKWGADLRPLCAQLTENLFKYRFFFDDELFQILHEFKHIAQDAVLLVDTYTRPNKAFDSDEYNRALQSFKQRQQKTNQLVEDIHHIITERLDVVRQI